MKAPKPNIVRVLPPAGTQVARVIGLVYEGTQQVEWKGETKEIPKVRISWELPLKLRKFKEDEPEKPFVVSQEFSHSMGSKSNLRPIVEKIIGTTLLDTEAYAFDLDEILGKPCLISIVHKIGKNGPYPIVDTASEVIEGMVVPPQINPTKVLSFEKWDDKLFDSLPQFIKDKIRSSPEYKTLKGLDTGAEKKIEYPEEEISSDDIPF